MWIKTQKPPILPPEYSRAGGRPPRQARKRQADEAPKPPPNPHKLGRYLKQLNCSRCKKMGHNVRTCKAGFVAPRKKTNKHTAGPSNSVPSKNSSHSIPQASPSATQCSQVLNPPATQCSQVLNPPTAFTSSPHPPTAFTPNPPKPMRRRMKRHPPAT